MLSTPPDMPPDGWLQTLRQHWRADLLSGLLVFLLALPLCLAIAQASGFPPTAGLLTAVLGGLVVPLLGGAELTIKAPAAGLVLLVAGAVQELGRGDVLVGYQLTLAAIALAGVLQIIFGLLHSGGLGDLLPSAVVYGMMAAIGMMLMLRQLLELMGTHPATLQPGALLLALPTALRQFNPAIGLLGGLSVLLLFGWPKLAGRWARRVPAPLLVLVLTVPLGWYWGLNQAHTYQLGQHTYALGPEYLVQLPHNLRGTLAWPDFSQVFTGISLKYSILLAVVGSLESLLSVRAVDLLAPQRRRSPLNRELLALGVGNTLAGLLGGLPMMADVVRSTANVRHGARTRWAGLFQGLLLLVLVALLPGLLRQIPQATLAAMLLHAGYRLAAPREFVHMLRIGGEQLAVFLVTLLVTLGTNLLLGVGAGMLTMLGLHLWRGLPLRQAFRADAQVLDLPDGSFQVQVRGAAVFSNYLSLKTLLGTLPQGKHVAVDLSGTTLVDHTVMEHLQRFRQTYAHTGGQVVITGLQRHRAVSTYPTATRIRLAA